MDAEDFDRAGLYDPGEVGAADRLDLLRYLADRGASIERMREAEAEARLHSLGLDLLLESGTMTADELAAAVGISPHALVETYRMFGVNVDRGEELLFDASEAELLNALADGTRIFPEDVAWEITRAVSAALATLAAAAVAAFVGSVEGRLVSDAGHLERARLTTDAGALALDLAGHLGPLFRHHLREAVQRQRSTMEPELDRSVSRLAVGFVDLVGYTAATASMAPAELVGFTGEFHRRAYDVVTRLGGQVVKHIGDAIMFSSLSSRAGCEIGLALIESFDEGDGGPRGGLAHGSLVARHGDLYGPVVNLAARLADVAVPGELLAAAEVASAAAGEPGLRFDPAGRRQLKGFAEAVAVVSVGREGQEAG